MLMVLLFTPSYVFAITFKLFIIMCLFIVVLRPCIAIIITDYSFQVKKCGQSDCTTCRPVRIDPAVFSTLHFLPNPVSGLDDHCKSFEEI